MDIQILPSEVQQLKVARRTMMRLHKALLDAERDSYEWQHGRLASNLAFYNLVMGHEWFQWIRPMTQWIAAVDEAVARKDDPIAEDEARQFLTDLRDLVPAQVDESVAPEHHLRYCLVIDRVPAVAQLHEEICLVVFES
jgi:hypothetical protein